MPRPQKSAEVLFSAYAEVFPLQESDVGFWQPFLCLRRGVSDAKRMVQQTASFSLPTQRCFYISRNCRCYADFSLPTQRCFRVSL